MARLSRVQFLGWFYHKPFVIFKEVGAGVCDFLKPIYGLNKCGCIDYINKIFLKYVWKRSYFLIVLFNCVVLCLDAQLCPTLCDPMECSLPGSSVHGILQARTLEWVALPSPGLCTRHHSKCLYIVAHSNLPRTVWGRVICYLDFTNSETKAQRS